MTETNGKSVCSVEGCSDVAQVKGMCRTHYTRDKEGWKDPDAGRHGPLKGRICRICGKKFDATDGRQTVCDAHKICSVEGCGKKTKARGLCPACYSKQWRRRNLRRVG